MSLEQSPEKNQGSLEKLSKIFEEIQQQANSPNQFSPQSAQMPSLDSRLADAENIIKDIISPFQIAGIDTSSFQWGESFDEIPKTAKTIQAYRRDQNFIARLRNIAQKPKGASETLNTIYRALFEFQEKAKQELEQKKEEKEKEKSRLNQLSAQYRAKIGAVSNAISATSRDENEKKYGRDSLSLIDIRSMRKKQLRESQNEGKTLISELTLIQSALESLGLSESAPEESEKFNTANTAEDYSGDQDFSLGEEGSPSEENFAEEDLSEEALEEMRENIKKEIANGAGKTEVTPEFQEYLNDKRAFYILEGIQKSSRYQKPKWSLTGNAYWKRPKGFFLNQLRNANLEALQNEIES